MRIGHRGNARQRAVGDSQHHVKGMHYGSFGALPATGGSSWSGRWSRKLNAGHVANHAVAPGGHVGNRHAPNRRARISFNCEVWSNVSETISGPRLYGEVVMQGTRKPRPSGPRMPPDPGTASMLGTVTVPKIVPGSAVGA